MSYPRFYRAVLDLVRDALLETSTARAIARKGLRLLGFSEAVPGPRLIGQWGALALNGESDGYRYHTLFGDRPFPVLYSGEPLTPNGADPFNRYAALGSGEVRITANVIDPGESGLFLYVDLVGGTFPGTFPTLPLDTAGFHVSDWVPLDVSGDGLVFGLRTDSTDSYVGTLRVGTIQVQWR